MSTAATVVWGTLLVLVVAVPSLLRWQARRASLRNREGVCGRCGLPLLSGDAPAYVEGFRICGPCARRMRRRTSVAIGALAATCGIVLIMGVFVTLDVIRTHGAGWGAAAFYLATGGAFTTYLVIIVRARLAGDAALRARDRAKASPPEYDE